MNIRPQLTPDQRKDILAAMERCNTRHHTAFMIDGLIEDVERHMNQKVTIILYQWEVYFGSNPNLGICGYAEYEY